MSCEEFTKEAQIKNAKDRLIRWEEYRREMLSNLLNITLGLSTGLLGFVANVYHNPKNNTGQWWTYLLLGVSIFAAGIAWFSRFHDFRKTTEINKLKYLALKQNKNHDRVIENYRKCTSVLGTLTHTCVFIQIFAFLIAIVIICYSEA